MKAIKLLEKVPRGYMEEIFFGRIVYAVWYCHEDTEIIEFLNTSREIYKSVYSEKFEEFFQVIKNLDNSTRTRKDWIGYNLSNGNGKIFVRNDILDSYKEYAGLDDDCIECEPNFEAALKALEDLIRIRREERFTWKPGDFIVYESKEEFEKAIAKEGRTVTWID